MDDINKSCKNCVYLWIQYENGFRKGCDCIHENEETICDRIKARFRACKYYQHGMPLHESLERNSLSTPNFAARNVFEYHPRVRHKSVEYI